MGWLLPPNNLGTCWVRQTDESGEEDTAGSACCIMNEPEFEGLTINTAMFEIMIVM